MSATEENITLCQNPEPAPTPIQATKKGYVYKIWSNMTDKIYIGSTSQRYLCQRFASHKTMHRRGKTHTTAKAILDHDDCQIEMLEIVNYTDIHELLAREGHWIRTLGSTVINKNNNVGLSKEEKIIASRQASKNYYQNNTAIIKEKSKIRYANKKIRSISSCAPPSGDPTD